MQLPHQRAENAPTRAKRGPNEARAQVETSQSVWMERGCTNQHFFVCCWLETSSILNEDVLSVSSVSLPGLQMATCKVVCFSPSEMPRSLESRVASFR